MYRDYYFKVVSRFQYLGSTVNEETDEKEEIRRRIPAGNSIAVNKILRIRIVKPINNVQVFLRSELDQS